MKPLDLEAEEPAGEDPDSDANRPVAHLEVADVWSELGIGNFE